MQIQPLRRFSRATFLANIPGSKSYTNRALILAAQREGTTVIEHALHAEDTELLAECLGKFGGLSTRKTETGFVVTRSRAKLTAPKEELYIGAAGTPARFLLAFAASAEGSTIITGTKRLCERPMGDILHSFDAMGIRYTCLGQAGHLPVRIDGSEPSTNFWRIEGGVSSQFTSSLLLAAAQQRQHSKINLEVTGTMVSRPYVDMTVQMMRDCGIRVETPDLRNFVIYPGMPKKERIIIEADASAMSYFLAAGALTATPVRIPRIGRNSAQGDLGFARVLEAMGCQLTYNEDTIELQGAPLKGVEVDMDTMPDTVLTLAAVAARAHGNTHISNIANLRVKECDRIHAAVAELQRLGVPADEGADNITVKPNGQNLRPALVNTYDDHRVAMAFSLLGLLESGIEIENPACVAKSFPNYWTEFERFRQHHESALS